LAESNAAMLFETPPKNDYTLFCGGNVSWHKSKDLKIPDNIRRFYIPPRTPEMNPIEQLWQEIRKNGFKNVFFKHST
jgi:putative transposase